MVYFRTVFLLVQVLSVLADDGVGPKASPADSAANVPDGSAAGEWPDVIDPEDSLNSRVFFDYDGFSQGCKEELLLLNKPLAEVFASITGGLKFEPNCTEINLAVEYLEKGSSSYDTTTTHLNLFEKNVKKLSDLAGIKSNFQPVLKNRLEQVGLGDRDEIIFGCASVSAGTMCYYRLPGVTVEPASEEEEEDESSGGSGGEGAESDVDGENMSELELM